VDGRVKPGHDEEGGAAAEQPAAQRQKSFLVLFCKKEPLSFSWVLNAV
jgi:hypothetical protein